MEFTDDGTPTSTVHFGGVSFRNLYLYQTKFLDGDITSNADADEGDLTFSLTAGQTYRISTQVKFKSDSTDNTCDLELLDGGTSIGRTAGPS